MSIYAIVIQKTQATLKLNLPDDKSQDQSVELLQGTMVETIGLQFNKNYHTVMIHDYHQRNFAFENNLYFIKQSALYQVSAEIWPFLIAVTDANIRASIAKDENFSEYILRLQLKSFVSVDAQYFSICPIRQSLQFLPQREPNRKQGASFDCIVRYIGEVKEIGPGFYFGLELLVIFFN